MLESGAEVLDVTRGATGIFAIAALFASAIAVAQATRTYLKNRLR